MAPAHESAHTLPATAAAAEAGSSTEGLHFAVTPRRKKGSKNSRPSRLATRQRVQERLLRRPIPCKEDVDDALEALTFIEEVRRCFPRGPPRDDTLTPLATPLGLEKAWASLLNSVYAQHAEGIARELGPGTSFEPLYPYKEVQEQFLAFSKNRHSKRAVSYHGTKAANIESISTNGLIIPGKRGITVANGKAHGLGIYTARLGAFSLSQGFCDSESMFVCAVNDTSQPKEQPDEKQAAPQVPPWKPSMTYVQTRFPKHTAQQTTNRSAARFEVRARSDEILRVGDAIVVFEEACVVPVFKVTWTKTEVGMPEKRVFMPRPAMSCPDFAKEEEELPWDLPQQVGRKRLAMPEHGEQFVKYGGLGRVGRTVWLPAMPLKFPTSYERRVKRRRNRREWQVRRKGAMSSRRAELGIWHQNATSAG